MEMKRRLVAVEVEEPTRKIHASVWRLVKRESKNEGSVFTVTISFRASIVVSGIPIMVAAEARRDNHVIPAQKDSREQRRVMTDRGTRICIPN
jgi:hypothetical protein